MLCPCAKLSMGVFVVFAFTIHTFAEDRELQQAQEAHAKTVQRLDDVLYKARRAHAQKMNAATRDLIAQYDSALKRALDDGDKDAVERLRSTRSALASRIPKPLDNLAKQSVYECVLGVYGRSIRAAQYPFVNLRPPRRDLWTEEIQRQLREKISFDGIEYISTAKLAIPKDGWYTVDIPAIGTQLRLNGLLLSGGDVELTEGVYDVEIYTNTWGQPYLTDCSAAVRLRGTDSRIPFVNTGQDIDRFLDQRIDGRRVTEVSGHPLREVDISLAGSKGQINRQAVEATE